MFTVKIQRNGGTSVRLFSMTSVRAMNALSSEFHDLLEHMIALEDDPDVRSSMETHHGYVCDLEGDSEYWLAGDEECYITDQAGKTVYRIMPPTTIEINSEDEFKAKTGIDFKELIGRDYPVVK